MCRSELPTTTVDIAGWALCNYTLLILAAALGIIFLLILGLYTVFDIPLFQWNRKN
jgi:hypothetical protein